LAVGVHHLASSTYAIAVISRPCMDIRNPVLAVVKYFL
jgi:hypothetical protein